MSDSLASPRTSTSAGLRVGDADRSALAERLSAHAAAGRLTLDELEQRLSAAHAAVYARELTALERDLPEPAVARPARRPQTWPLVLVVALIAASLSAGVSVGHPVGFPLVLGLLAWRFAGGRGTRPGRLTGGRGA